MSFAWPAWLLALFVIPALVAAYWLVQQRRSQYAVKFTNVDLLANLIDKTPGWKRHVAPSLYLLALAGLVVAMARPQAVEKIPKEEATVILVMDVSGSMNATDVLPSRLEAARESAINLVESLPDRFQISLIAFASNVRTVVPPTTDKDEVKRGIASLRAVSGTAMGDAIMQAVELAKPTDAADQPPGSADEGAAPAPAPAATPRVPGPDDRPAVIVLLSDGANSAGVANPIDAANEALARELPIFTIALGTQDGIVDITDNFGRTRRIPVPPDEETLQEIADITGGTFFSAESAGDLDSVYKDLGSKIGFDEEKRDISHYWAGVAAALMLAGGAVSLLWFNRFP